MDEDGDEEENDRGATKYLKYGKTTIQKYLHIGIALIVGISLGGLIASLLHPGADHTGQIASFCSQGHDCFETSAGNR